MKSLKTWGMAAGAASVALVAGLALPVGSYLGAVAALLLVAGAVIALGLQREQPFLGLAVLVVTAVVFPVEFRGPSAAIVSSSLPLSAFLCGAWLLHVALTRSFDVVDGSRVIYAALAFVGVTLIAFLAGQYPWFPTDGAPLPAQVAELGIFLTSVFLFLAVGHQVRSLGQLRSLTWSFLVAGSVAAVVQTVGSLAVTIGPWTTRPGSIGSLFWTWLVALSFSQAVFNRRLAVPVRLWLLGINALVFFHGLVQVRSWASGWLPPLAALGTIVLIGFPRLVVAAGCVTVPVALFFSGDISRWLLGDEGYSLSTRLAAWDTLGQLVQRSPLFGTGLTNYYYYTENLPIMGWYVRFISHNNYQDLLIQTGILGLLGFLWLAFEIFWMTFRVFRRAPVGFARAYALGAIGGLAGSLVAGWLGDWIIPFYYNAGIIGFRSSLLFWVFLGGVLALKRMAFRQSDAEALAHRETWPTPRHQRSLAGAH